MTRYEEFVLMRAVSTDDCILWPYATDPYGYPHLKTPHGEKFGHRLSCEMRHGPPPGRYDAAHTCRTPACINPRHLRWATRSENQQDRVADGTSNRGERCGNAKLTASDVWGIKFFLRGGLPTKTIAQHFGVGRSNISAIRCGRSWTHLEGAA